MNNQIQRLTSAQIKYLLTIYKLSKSSVKIRSLDIAILLGLAKSSVHKMINTLKAMDLVDKEPYGEIILTDNGKTVAENYQKYYNSLYKILPLVKSKAEESENAILAFLSELSPESLESIVSDGLIP